MTFRRNVLLSYISQAYVTGIGLVMVPFYLQYLGAEAYGLVGFFTMLQAWFQLLDMGLSPTLSREVARFRAGAVTGGQLRLLLRAMEYFFLGIALLAALAAVAASGFIATQWLQPRELAAADVQEAVVLMALAVPLRWASGLYRGAVNGFERQALLAGFNVGTATARFVGVVAVLHFVSASPRAFFVYQLLVAFLEVAGLWLIVHRLLPKADSSEARAQLSDIVGALRFSMGVSLTGAIWIVLTQADKLLLSRLLDLSDFGYLTLAVAVAGGVNVVSTPLAQNLMPRLAKLHAQGDEAALTALYRRSTRVIALAVGAVSGLLAFCAQPLLYAWTGDAVAAERAHAPLAWYALGNALLALTAFPYYLQYARGTLRLHLMGNVALAVVMLPMVGILAARYGAVGGGLAWFFAIALYFLVWVSYSHKKLLGHFWHWLWRDAGVYLLLPLMLAGCVAALIGQGSATRTDSFVTVFGVASALALLALFLVGRWSGRWPRRQPRT